MPAGSVEDKYEPEDNFQNPDIVKDDLFSRKLSSISLKIIERNQAEIAPAYAGTQEIDELLEALAKEMPDSVSLGYQKVQRKILTNIVVGYSILRRAFTRNKPDRRPSI